MVFGFTADSFRFLSVANVLRIFRWSGLRFAEVTTAVFCNPDKALRYTGSMKLGLHLPNAGNRGYDFSSQKHAAIIRDDLLRIGHHRCLFRFQYAVFHPPEMGTLDSTKEFFIQNLRQVGVPLVLENIRGYTPETLMDFYKWLKNDLGDRLWGICLDIPHAHLTDRRWKDYFYMLRAYVRVIHLSNCKDGDDKHLPFVVEGDLALEPILTLLKREKYDGFLNFEILPPSIPDAIRLFPMIQQLRNYG